MFFIAQIQVAQQYSSLTAQNNSATGTRRHRSHVCVYENWIQCPTSKTVTDDLEVLRTFLAPWEMLQGGEGNPCKNQVQCQKKSNASWIAYNSLMQHFVISHETPRRDKRHRCDSTPRSDFRMLPHIICRFQMIVEFSPKDGVIHLLFTVQIPNKGDW